jgi:hypothetical protein
MRIALVKRLLIIAFIGAAVLGGLGGVTPPAARAEPPDGTDPGDSADPCVKQTVTGAQAELVGRLRLLDPSKPPMTGQETRIIMDAAAIRMPDPYCEGRSLNWTTLSPRWSVVARPAGSAANPTAVGTTTARLVPDRGGAWTVRFTACPAGCLIRGVHVPAQSKDITFTVTVVREARVSSAELQSALGLLLPGTRIQISHTGNGTTADGTPYTVRWSKSVSPHKYQQLCDGPASDDDPKTNPAPICEDWEDGTEDGQVTYRTITPEYHSYIDFTPLAEANGAPAALPLPIDVVEKDLSFEPPPVFRELHAAAAAFAPVDIDRIRVLANNLHVVLGLVGSDAQANTNWWLSIAGGGVNLGVKFQSSDPSVKCEAHWKAQLGYFVTLSEGWSDNLCPDYNLSRMTLSVTLVPKAVDGRLTLGDAQVTAQLEPASAKEELIDIFRNVSNRAAAQIQEKVRDKLLEEQTRKDMGKLLTAALKKKYPDLCRVVSAEVVGSDLVVHYQAQAPLHVALPCAGGGAMPPITGGGAAATVEGAAAQPAPMPTISGARLTPALGGAVVTR